MLDLELVLAGDEFTREGGDLELTSSWKGDAEGEIKLNGARGCGNRGELKLITGHSGRRERKERAHRRPHCVGVREKEERKRGRRRR
uniref:Uncharacterized protein n=1 Tax=Oryza glumipatula TaxID=40148 RepID=A0A0D9Y9Y6_9ORYZ